MEARSFNSWHLCEHTSWTFNIFYDIKQTKMLKCLIWGGFRRTVEYFFLLIILFTPIVFVSKSVEQFLWCNISNEPLSRLNAVLLSGIKGYSILVRPRACHSVNYRWQTNDLDRNTYSLPKTISQQITLTCWLNPFSWSFLFSCGYSSFF